MKLTSGFNFENYEITDYLGFCSGEYALNTKFLSDFNLLSSYSEKLEEAQKNALDILINNAKQMGADAIIGLDIDYTTDDHDIMGVIANGTAVTIQSTLKEPAVPVKINVINYNPDLEFRVSSLTILPDTEKSTITATLFGKSSENITGLLADIFLVDIFDELHPVHYTGFSRFDVAQNFATSISTPVPCSLELNILPLIKSTRHFPACSHNFPKAGEARFQGLSRLFRLLGKFPYLGESRRILMAVSSKTSSKTRFCYAATRRISSAAVQPSIWA